MSKDISLSKYIAQAGVCARRKATELIKDGLVKVGGVITVNPAYRVAPKDIVVYQNRALVPSQHIYVILNKPRHVITTVSDEQGRRTVLDLLPGHIKRRVYPVGRLDKDTSGLLLLTNDGILAQYMAHPRYKVQKTYHVTLDRVISEGLLERIRLGIRLSDGMVRIDEIRYLSPDNHAALHIVLCSGRNRVIKRLFEQLGFWVKRLNRPYYAGLSTKGLAHGEWRYCTDREISALKKASGKRATCGNLTGL